MLRTTRTGVLWVVCALAVFSGVSALGQEVTLPLSQYEELRSRANPQPDDPAPPPARFALESADLEISVGASSARIVQKLVLSVFSDTWERVPLGEAGSFTSARFGNLEGRVETGEQGWALQVHGRGRHEVTLESVVPVRRDETSTRPASSFSLLLPPAAVLRGKLAAQPGIEEVTLDGKGLIREGAKGSGAWTFVASFDKTAQVTFTLFGLRTLPERAQLPLRYDATSATAVILSRTQLRVRGWVEARVAQGQLKELRIPVPAGLQVVSVNGPIAGWDVVEGTLVITPPEPVEGTLAVELELSGEPKAAFTSPVLTPAGSRRTLYLIKAALQGDGTLTLVEAGAVRSPEDSETSRLPPALQSAGGQFRVAVDPSKPPRWEAEWAGETEVLAVQVDRLLLDVAVGESGRAVYRLWAEVRNRGAQQLVFAMPPGFELSTARRDGEEVTVGSAAGGLAVPLLTRDAAQAIHLDGVLPFALPAGRKGDLTLILPALSAPAARIEVRLVLPGGRTYQLADPSRSGQVQGPPQGAPVASVSSNALAAQMKSGPSRDRGDGTLPGMFLIPSGFKEVTAAWSALSANPAPLVLHVETEREETPWM